MSSLSQEVLDLMAKVHKDDEALSLCLQDNIRNPLTFIGLQLRRARKKAQGTILQLPMDIVDEMIKAVERAEKAICSEK